MFRLSSLSVALGLALLAFSLVSQGAAAATITVTTEDDEFDVDNGECALREAIVNANNDDQSGSDDCAAGNGDDTIVVPAGTYLLDLSGSGATLGDLDLTSNITINGAGVNQTFLVANELDDRVFDLSGANTVVTIAGLFIRGGHTDGDGGGVRNTATLTLRDVILFENTADEDGGGIYHNAPGKTLTLIRTTLDDNTSLQDGAGLFNNAGTVNMTDGAIINNQATEDAGGLRNESGATVHLTRVTIDGNTTQQDAGGVRNDGTMTMKQVTVSNNIAADTSGGIENRGTLDIADSTIANNQAGDDGGGIQNSDGADLTIVRSAIVGNTTAEDGAGIDFDGGTANLTNVTISGNTATVDGGGVEGSDGATIDLLHVTIADNSASGQGDGIFNDTEDSATIRIRSTLIANNGSGPNCEGDPITSQGFNLEFPGNSCDLGAAGDRPNTDPVLGPLANNGGPTPTHALLAGSGAIDTASNATCPATDQRGEPRPVDGDRTGSATCDIGAYEVQVEVAQVRNEPSEDDKKKETEEQRQQRERTNNSNKSEYATEGNVLGVERTPDGKHLLVTIGLTKNEKLTVQVTCVDMTCPDIRVGDYLEADGYQNGVGDPNDYFIAEDVTIRRNGKKVN